MTNECNSLLKVGLRDARKISHTLIEQVYLDFTNKLKINLPALAARLAPASHKRGLGCGDGEKKILCLLKIHFLGPIPDFCKKNLFFIGFLLTLLSRSDILPLKDKGD